MKRTSRFGSGIAYVGFILLFAAGSSEVSRGDEAATAPGMYNKLPYFGYGIVSVLDDGTLLIELGPRPGSVAPDLGGDETFSSEDVLAFSVPTTNLSLVESGGEVFLDCEGRQLRDRGLSESAISRTVLRGPKSKRADAPLSTVARFVGDVTLQYDRTSKILTVAAQDTETTGKSFTLSAPVRTDAERGRNDSELVLVQGGPVSSSSCSISCSQGSGSVSCSGGCFCRCVNGKPKCDCLSSL